MSKEFERSVLRRVADLQNKCLGEIETNSMKKRRQWLEDNSERLRSERHVSPRSLYELFFFEYMGLAREDLPIASESKTQITWLSKNPCDTLEACQRLGMDTRKVCKGAYERSTQAFFSWFDPRYRFIRDYDEIRPHSPHCREQIVRVDFEANMRIAIEQARASRRTGNKGYGAVVVLGERLLSCRHDTAATEGDPSLHAEVNAIRDATRALGRADLSGAVVISTCEPCPMCSSLAVWANLSAIVFGASIEDTAKLGKARILVPATEIVGRSPVRVEVVSGVLRNDCIELYR